MTRLKARTASTGISVFSEQFPSALDFDADRFRSHREWLQENLRDETSEFQKFIRMYYMEGSSLFEKSLNRFSLCIELIDAYCPKEGAWFDAGSMGHDAIRVKILRPDISIKLAVYEGCVVYQDEKGLHYYSGSEVPEPSVYSEKLDLEKDTITAPDESMDLVTSFEVLEHYKFTPIHFMREANRILRFGGKLVLSTPNATSAQSVGQILRGLHPAECGLYHTVPSAGRIHPLEYSRAQIVDLLTHYGFEIEVLASVNLSAFDDVELAAIDSIRRFRDTCRLDAPLDFGQKWIVIAKKTSTVDTDVFPESLFA